MPIGFGIVLLIIYFLAIRETFEVRKDCIDLAGQVKVVGDAPDQIALLRNKLNELSSIIEKDTIASGTDPLLEFISISNVNMHISLVDYSPLHVFQSQDYQIETRIAVFEGSYIMLLKFLYHIENKFKNGKVVSVKFENEINFKTDRKRLLMTLYVQSVLNKETGTNAQAEHTQLN